MAYGQRFRKSIVTEYPKPAWATAIDIEAQRILDKILLDKTEKNTDD